MSNICETNIVFEGDYDNIDKLENLFKSNFDLNRMEDNWIDKAIVYSGIFDGEEDKQSIEKIIDECNLRGYIYNYRRLTKESFEIELEEDWCPQEIFYDFIASLYDLSYVFISEEAGCQLFINTDCEGRYFSTRYRIYNSELDDFEDIYSDTLENGLKKYKQVLVNKYNWNREEVNEITVDHIDEFIDEFEYKGNYDGLPNYLKSKIKKLKRKINKNKM